MPDRRHPPTILPCSHTTMPWRRHVVIAAAAALSLAAAPTACLDRPVALQQPTTSRVSTVVYRSQQVDKIDLLFMIDNSASMGDKQKILAQAVPDLLTRLTTPRCIDVGSGAAVARDPATGQCPDGSEPEFEPVTDIHIGVISSSIGGHGSDACARGTVYGYNLTQEDMSHLLTRGKSQPQVDTYQGKGYLQWDPEQKLTPPGTGKIEDLTGRFTDIVAGVGEQGCWYEASLEAWYRFLVDPAPYAKLVKRPCDDAHPESQCVFPEGVDTTVLTQRADFLRSDSLPAIINAVRRERLLAAGQRGQFPRASGQGRQGGLASRPAYRRMRCRPRRSGMHVVQVRRPVAAPGVCFVRLPGPAARRPGQPALLGPEAQVWRELASTDPPLRGGADA